MSFLSLDSVCLISGVAGFTFEDEVWVSFDLSFLSLDSVCLISGVAGFTFEDRVSLWVLVFSEELDTFSVTGGLILEVGVLFSTGFWVSLSLDFVVFSTNHLGFLGLWISSLDFLSFSWFSFSNIYIYLDILFLNLYYFCCFFFNFYGD